MQEIPPRPDGLHTSRPTGDPAPAGSAPAPSRPSWSPGEALGVYLLGFVISAIAITPFLLSFGDSPTTNIIANSLVALVLIGILAAWLRLRHREGALEAIGLRSARPLRDLASGVAFGLALYPAVAIVVASGLQIALEAISGTPVSAPEQVPTDLPPLGIAVVVVYAVLVAPVGEELFFRGILFPSIAARTGFWPAALLSGIAFGLIHYVPSPWPDAVLLMSVMVPTGMGLAWIRSRRGSLYASIGSHLAFNVIGLLLIYVFG